MTHETAAHVKRRKMQTNKAILKLHPQVLLLQDFLQGIPARHSCKGSSKRFLKGSCQGSSKGFLQRFRQKSQHHSFSKGSSSFFWPATTSKKKETKQNPKKIQKLSSYRFQQGCKTSNFKPDFQHHNPAH